LRVDTQIFIKLRHLFQFGKVAAAGCHPKNVLSRFNEVA